jgi:hypothetical protein
MVHIKVADRPHEYEVKAKIYGNDSNKPYRIHKRIKSRLNSVNACYHFSSEYIFFSFLLSQNINIITFWNVLYGCDNVVSHIKERYISMTAIPKVAPFILSN